MEEPPDFTPRPPLATVPALSAAVKERGPLHSTLGIAFDHLGNICDAPELLLLRRVCKEARGIVDQHFSAKTLPERYGQAIVRLIEDGGSYGMQVKDELAIRLMYYAHANMTDFMRMMYTIKLLRIHTIVACTKTYLWRPIRDTTTQHMFLPWVNHQEAAFVAVMVRGSLMVDSDLCPSPDGTSVVPLVNCVRCRRLMSADPVHGSTFRSRDCYRLRCIQLLNNLAVELLHRYTSRYPDPRICVMKNQDPRINVWTRSDVRAVTVHVANHYKIDWLALYLCAELMQGSITRYNERLNWKEYAESMEEKWRHQDEETQKSRALLAINGGDHAEVNNNYDEPNNEYEDIEAPRARRWGRVAAAPPPLQAYDLLRNALLRTGSGIHRAARWMWTAAAVAVNAVRNNNRAMNLYTAVEAARRRLPALQALVQRAPLAQHHRQLPNIRTGLGVDEVDAVWGETVQRAVVIEVGPVPPPSAAVRLYGRGEEEGRINTVD